MSNNQKIRELTLNLFEVKKSDCIIYALQNYFSKTSEPISLM